MGNTYVHAFKPAKKQAKARPGGFIDSYGKAFVEYSAKVSESKGKMEQEERQRLYDDLFAGAKKAYSKEQYATQKRLAKISQNMNTAIQTASSSEQVAGVPKKESETAVASPNGARQPAAVVKGSTGEIGKAGGADEVKFGKQEDDLFAVPSVAPSAAPSKDAASPGGAESVSFSSQ